MIRSRCPLQVARMVAALLTLARRLLETAKSLPVTLTTLFQAGRPPTIVESRVVSLPRATEVTSVKSPLVLRVIALPRMAMAPRPQFPLIALACHQTAVLKTISGLCRLHSCLLHRSLVSRHSRLMWHLARLHPRL